VIRQATVRDVSEMAMLWDVMGAERDADGDYRAWAAQQTDGIRAGMVLAVVLDTPTGLKGFADGALVYEPGTRKRTLVGRHLYVAPEARERGNAERLMWRLLALARQSGAESLLTHGGPSAHAVEKLLGKTMRPHFTTKEIDL